VIDCNNARWKPKIKVILCFSPEEDAFHFFITPLSSDILFYLTSLILTVFTNVQSTGQVTNVPQPYILTNCYSHQHFMLTGPAHKFPNAFTTFGPSQRHFLRNWVTAAHLALKRTGSYIVWVIFLRYGQILSAVYSHLLIYCQFVLKYSDINGLSTFNIPDICIAIWAPLNTWANVHN